MEVQLTQGKIALIDEADWPLVSRWRWTYLPNGRSGYAVRWETVDGKKRTIYLHRFLMQAEAGQVVDHENGDGLDNRRANLRLCGASHNGANKPVAARAIPYRGVYRNKPGRRAPFKAQIKAFRKCWHLGEFLDQEAAARAYDRAALHFFDRFARLNFPDQVETTRALPLASAIERRVSQPLLPLFDGVEPWDDGDFPEPPPLRPDWYEINYLQRARQASAASAAVAVGEVYEDIPF